MHPMTREHQSQLSTVTHHQNIIGWDNFIRGYISKHWCIPTRPTDTKSKPKWADKLISLTLQLHKKIWEGRNTHVHGKDNEEARRKAREAILAKVASIYKNPPRLATRYPSVLSTPLEQRKKRTTAQLHEWIHRLQHQIHISNILHSTLPPGQLTLQQAYKKHGYSTHRNVDYPP